MAVQNGFDTTPTDLIGPDGLGWTLSGFYSPSAGAEWDAGFAAGVASTVIVAPTIVITSPDLGPDDRITGDLKLTWSNVTDDADISLINFDADVDVDLAEDPGLITAVVLSLFTDRRAENDDTPPSGDARDRRGWWADQFAAVAGDQLGSRWWLLDRSKNSNEIALRRKEYAIEALAWMIEDKVVASIDVTVTRTSTGQLTEIDLQRPGRDPVSFRFAHAWDHLQETL